MWEVRNATPFSAMGYFQRDRAGLEHWVLAVRGRFALSHDRLPQIVKPPSVRLVPDYADETARELVAEADFAPFRPGPDILLRGTVQPPDDGGRSRPAGFRFGKLQKWAQVFGPRHVRRQGRQWLVERRPFEPFPLSWTRSLGGADVAAGPDVAEPSLHPANPIGTGWSGRMASVRDGTEFFLPQVERPGELMHPDRPLPEPIGFGALQPGWHPRAGRAGTFDEAWRRQHAPLVPLDFSETFYQAVPDDQVYPAALRGGEAVELHGFDPDGPLGFDLPQVLLDATTRIGTEDVPSRLRLIGIEIEATARTLDLVWNCAVPCPGADHLVDCSSLTVSQMAGFSR